MPARTLICALGLPVAAVHDAASIALDGRLARYYELETNRPLYMSRREKSYTLTYDDTDLPSHYGWKNQPRIAELEARYRELTRGIDTPPAPPPAPDIQKSSTASTTGAAGSRPTPANP